MPVVGSKALKLRLAKIKNQARGSHVTNALSAGAQVIRAEAVQSISKGGRSGNIYKRGKKRMHQASASGEPPKTDTGELVRNITVVAEKERVVTVGSRKQAPHGYWLETKEPSQGGRPWLRPAYKKSKDKVLLTVYRHMRKIVK